MEIKQGDTVRVSKDVPKMYLRGWAQVFQIREAEVIKVEDDNAVIEIFELSLAIPTKYLVKVDAEAKEAKFKVGDRVRFKNIYELQKVKDKSFRWMLVMFASKEATITAVEDNGFYRVDIAPSIGGINDDMIECKVNPTEQTETSADVLGEFTPISMSTNLIIGFEQAYWQEYEANLAKEVALKVANKFNDPEQAAEYAVSVAKAVVEGLKRK